LLKNINWSQIFKENNVKIYVTKILNIDICSQYDNILLTHADVINYDTNTTDLEIHKNIINTHKNKVNYVCNNGNLVNIIKGTDCIVYNKSNIVHYLNNLIPQFKNNITIDITKFYDHMLKYKYVNNEKLEFEIKKFNNAKLLEASKKIFKFMISLDEIKNKIKKFNNDRMLMEEHYICYRKNGSGQRANEYIRSSKITLFGLKYENVSDNKVCEMYVNDQKKLYIGKIKILHDMINEKEKREEKTINIGTQCVENKIKKRKIFEI
jgi:hypothetical protein